MTVHVDPARNLWWHETAQHFPAHFRQTHVLEVGAAGASGSLRGLVSDPASYQAIDSRPGPAVDVVCPAHAFAPTPPDRRFDTLVSDAMLEHDPAWMAGVAQTMQYVRPGGRAFWSWCVRRSDAHGGHDTTGGEGPPITLEAMLHLVEGLGYRVEAAECRATESANGDRLASLVLIADPRIGAWPRTAIRDEDRLAADGRAGIDRFLADWQAAYLARTREKWRELPGTRQGRVFSSDLLTWPDDELLAYWERSRQETTGPEVRGWFQELYRDRLRGRRVADVGPGLGIDGFFFARHGAQVTFVDIVADNLRLLERLAALQGLTADYLLIEDPFDIRLPHDVDALLCVGSMHNAPFEMSRRELASLARGLRTGGQALLLAYPRERYEALGCTSFEEFGRKCDGDRTPWCEWYDDDKVRQLFGPAFRLEWSRNFGQDGVEFNWFELTKTGEA
jgi:SAM-dependent methyltransferase